MNFSSFLVKSQDLGLRIFPLSPENPGSALLFSPVRRWEILGIFLSRESPAKNSRRPLPPFSSSSCWKILLELGCGDFGEKSRELAMFCQFWKLKLLFTGTVHGFPIVLSV
ncbi:hypothetical protein SLEP1_g24552 [Rubroshorea leprosula]|uniref:Uncharacterized protein n=1 Tax=Rubroshorea leprosula TaxID=152421 RepID=A0AAV5JJ62_9ROSI|nr:hypothetical protein SLEP1_g24552 [Rubroshorea leprosula]